MPSALFSDLVLLFIGVPITFFSWIIVGFLVLRRQKQKMAILNENLGRVEKRWSHEIDAIVDENPVSVGRTGSSETERASHPEESPDDPDESESIHNPYRTFMIGGFVLCIFSWLGFALSVVAWMSLFFVPSRREKRILKTRLATESRLGREQILQLLRQWEEDAPM